MNCQPQLSSRNRRVSMVPKARLVLRKSKSGVLLSCHRKALWFLQASVPNKALKSFASLTGTLRRDAAPRPLAWRLALEVNGSWPA